MNKSDVGIISEDRLELGEGLLWHPAQERLFFVDILGNSLYSFDWRTKKTAVLLHLPNELPSAVFCLKDPEKLLLAAGRTLYLVNASSASYEVFAELPSSSDVRLNDGEVIPGTPDEDGFLCIGTMDLSHKKPIAALYAVNCQGTITKLLDDCTISNGIIFRGAESDHARPSGRAKEKHSLGEASNLSHTDHQNPSLKRGVKQDKLLHIDSPRREIVSYSLERNGPELKDPAVLVSLDAWCSKGLVKSLVSDSSLVFDGMCAGSGTRAYVAVYGGGCIIEFDASSGEFIRSHELPVPKPTNCCFAGRDLSTLVITSCREKLTAEELERWPLSGALMALDVNDVGNAPSCLSV